MNKVYEVREGQVYTLEGEFYESELEACKAALEYHAKSAATRLQQAFIDFPPSEAAKPPRARRIQLHWKIRVQTTDGEWLHTFKNFSEAFDWAALRHNAREADEYKALYDDAAKATDTPADAARQRLKALVAASKKTGRNLVKAVECYGLDGKTYTEEAAK